MGTETIPKSEEVDKIGNSSELDRKIIRQIEYYFGNYNLGRDKFLKEQIKIDDGWVPLETMVKFNRLKSLSEDFSVISEALKKSPNHLMEVNEDGTKIRRRPEVPLPENIFDRQDEIDEKTLYVKGFKRSTTLDELLDFFKDHKAENIFMKRNLYSNNRYFKGSVFVTFETKEDAEKFLKIEGIKYCSTELLKEKKKDYIKRKDAYYDNLRAEKAKKMQKKAAEKQGDKENDINVPEVDFVSGCLLKLSNLSETCTREQIYEAFEPHGTVVYVDYSKGKPSGAVRFETAVAASVLEKLPDEDGEKKLEIGSCKAVISSIEGDEEKEYWKNIAAFRANARSKFNKNQRHFGNKGRFKKNWGKRQRGKDTRNDGKAEPSSKTQKNESNDDIAEEPAAKRIKTELNDGKAEPSSKTQKNESNDDNAEEPAAKRIKTELNDDNAEEPSAKRIKTALNDGNEEPSAKEKKIELSGKNASENEAKQNEVDAKVTEKQCIPDKDDKS